MDWRDDQSTDQAEPELRRNTMINSIFGRINSTGNVEVFFSECGESVTRFDESIATVYPVDSDLSAQYEHPTGIVLSQEDADKIGLSIE